MKLKKTYKSVLKNHTTCQLIIVFASIISLYGCKPDAIFFEERQELLKGFYFESFIIEAKNNPGLEQDIVFDTSNRTNIFAVLDSEIDLSRAVVTYKVHDGRVKVGDTEQISGKTVVNLNNPIKYSIYYDKYSEIIVNAYVVPYSGLPIVMINVMDQKNIEDTETWLPSVMRIYGVNQYEDFDDTIQIKGRGNSSWRDFPKKGYNIKLSQRHKVLDMDKHKRWCLIANWRDRTRLRNEVTYKLGRWSEGMEWNPHERFVELYLNGKHVGMYNLCETIRVDKNRVDIDELTTNDSTIETISGGYLLEVDDYKQQDNYFSTPLRKWPFGVAYPEEEDITIPQLKYIKSFIINLEQKLTERDFEYIRENVDYPSFVDYYLIQTFSGNQDFKTPRSLYFYKKRNGKLYAGPLWDFDYKTYIDSEKEFFQPVMYKYLFDDPEFIKVMKERWHTMSDSLVKRTQDYIDRRALYIKRSEIINGAMWPGVKDNGDELLDFDTAIMKMKDYVKARAEFMNGIIEGF